MPTVEERLAFLEGQVSEQSHGLSEVRDSVRHLEQRLESRFDALEQRMDQRFVSIDQRFASIDQRFVSIDQRFGTLEDKLSSQFLWTVGVQVTTFVAIVAALLSRG